jgi:DNA repair protein RecO (recombination protein O)
MEWRADAILLGTRRHGEHAAILDVFTADHGRHMGVLPGGGASRKIAPLLQTGSQFDVTWRARLDHHMGRFSVDLLKSRAAPILDNPLALAGLSSVCAILSFALPERQAYPALYAHSCALLDHLDAPDWARSYVLWELAVLDHTGFGLDLNSCAVTGAGDDLAYISPRTGRAVARSAAGKWRDRLLPLSPALQGAPYNAEYITQALRVTGHFLGAYLAPSLGDTPLPAARARYIARLARQARLA